MQQIVPEATSSVVNANIPLERDVFLRTLVRELANVLDDVVGEADAANFISVVGQVMGRQMDGMYRQALGVERLNRDQIAAVLIDLKRRIQGSFYLIEADENRLVFGNNDCPFAEKVVGRKSMCMMTTNVFGVISANHGGYSKVQLERTIAEGHRECRVVVHLRPGSEANAVDGREFFRD